MRIWFDTEFIEDGETIDLISVGMVREDGMTLYLENTDCRLHRASDWVKQNVIPHLKYQRDGAIEYAFGKSINSIGIVTDVFGATSRKYIAKHIVDFAGASPEFWAYFASYDWVVLCQLFGPMSDLPKHWPMFVRDVKQEAERICKTLPEHTGTAHNALEDAVWLKSAHLWLEAQQERMF